MSAPHLRVRPPRLEPTESLPNIVTLGFPLDDEPLPMRHVRRFRSSASRLGPSLLRTVRLTTDDLEANASSRALD